MGTAVSLRQAKLKGVPRKREAMINEMTNIWKKNLGPCAPLGVFRNKKKYLKNTEDIRHVHNPNLKTCCKISFQKMVI